MYSKRTDKNHKEMITALRAEGYTMHDTSNIGNGIPDAIMCQGEHCEWLEIKSGPGSGLTLAEAAFHDVCPGGRPILAWTPALAIAEFERRKRKAIS